MIPGTANLSAAANAYDERTITLPGFNSAAGITATVEFRASASSTAALYLTLTSTNNAGLTLSISGGNLVIDWLVTETQIDTMAAALATAGLSQAYYSLKITLANGRTQQWLVGTYTVIPTATQ